MKTNSHGDATTTEDEQWSDDVPFDRLIAQIGYLGALYGLAPLTASIFAYLKQSGHAESGALGEALIAVSTKSDARAIEIIDKSGIDTPEGNFLLAIALKRSGTDAERLEAVVGKLRDQSQVESLGMVSGSPS